MIACKVRTSMIARKVEARNLLSDPLHIMSIRNCHRRSFLIISFGLWHVGIKWNRWRPYHLTPYGAHIFSFFPNTCTYHEAPPVFLMIGERATFLQQTMDSPTIFFLSFFFQVSAKPTEDTKPEHYQTKDGFWNKPFVSRNL